MALLDQLFLQLRSTWPMAAVIAEFVTVQDGQFIVRALVQVGGISLASGLAAAPTIEAAEDRAKERAIQALRLPHEIPGSVSSGAIAPIPSLPTPSLPPSPPGSPSLAAPSFSLPPLPTPTPTPPPAPVPAPEPPPGLDDDFSGPVVADLYSHAAYHAPDEPEDDLDPRQVLEQMVPASTLLSKDKSETSSTSSDPKKPRRKETKADSPKIPDSVDLSDVIAQTDVELQRLGWTRVQGRDYLLQTYNKKTRSELSELELYEFLSYLKSQ